MADRTDADAASHPIALLGRIAEAEPDLRRSERKVAQTILDDPKAALALNMAGLAKAAQVSEPTVMRFCSAVGYEGFRSFKLALAQNLAFGLPPTHSAIRPGDTSGELAGKIFDHTLSSLGHARQNLDQEVVTQATDALACASDILFIGFGASGIVAEDAQQKFPLFGVPCNAPIDAHQQFIAASLSRPASAVVAISNTGRTRSIIDCAKVARSNGATVIGISGGHTPLFEHCDVGLAVESLEDTDFYTPTISRLAQLVVIDILATGVALRQGPDRKSVV